VEVLTLDPNGPAAKAEIAPGDIVLEMNGTPVESVDDLHRLLSEATVREIARITILRGVERRVLEVPVAEPAPRTD
jgi:S1-C subfamily serine protease